MKNYKISIIIPTYNRAWCLNNAIKSVMGQDYKNWELFIIDDGSTDNTEEVVKKYCNDKVHYFYKENSGKLPTVNYGIDFLISGDILFVLDSDDELLPDILCHVADEFHKNPSYVSIHYRAKFPSFIKRKSELIDTNDDYKIVDYEMLLRGRSHRGDFHGFINVKSMSDIRFSEECPNGMENIFWLDLLKKGDSKYFNKDGLFMDSSRGEGDVVDNLTSYHCIYGRAASMINGYDILIQKNENTALEIDSNILSGWYFDQFQWCIIDRKIKKGYFSWVKAIRYGNIKNKIKVVCFGVLFLVPSLLLPTVLKFYYRIK